MGPLRPGNWKGVTTGAIPALAAAAAIALALGGIAGLIIAESQGCGGGINPGGVPKELPLPLLLLLVVLLLLVLALFLFSRFNPLCLFLAAVDSVAAPSLADPAFLALPVDPAARAAAAASAALLAFFSAFAALAAARCAIRAAAALPGNGGADAMALLRP